MRAKLFSSTGVLIALVLAATAGLTFGPGLFGSGNSIGSEPTDASGSGTPVVLIILDELPTATLVKRDQTIDANRFPNINRFAAGATWYRDHAAAGDFTAWAVPPILTGNHSNERTLPTNAVQPDNIFNLLGPGRTVHAMEDVTELCSREICPDGHQGEYPDIPEADEFIKAKFKLVDIKEVDRWIETIPAGDHTLSILHLPLPHQPLFYLPRGQRYPGGPIGFPIDGERNDWTISDAGVAFIQQRHLLQAGYADLMVGRIMKKIRMNGDWNRSLVIVTADHGSSFDVRYDRRDAEPGSIAATLNPPLMIKYPKQAKGQVSKKPTQATDLVPTIADLLGVPDLYPTEGVPIDRIPAGREMIADKDLGARIRFTAAEIRAQRPALVRRSRKRFGTGGLWRLGPRAGLIGKRAPRTRKVRGAAVKFDSASRLARARPGSSRVPSLVSGVVFGIGGNRIVALAVNGRITGTTRTFPFGGRMRFGSMVKPTSFRRGPNRATLYLAGPGKPLKRIRTRR